MFGLRADQRVTTWSWGLHLAGAAVTFALIAAVTVFAVRPMQTREAALHQRMAALQETLAVETAIRADHEDLSTRIGEMEGAMTRMMDRIPNVPRESDFLGQVTALADEVGLIIIDYRPGQVSSRKGYKQMNLTLSSDGSWDAVCRFLSRLGELPRLNRVLEMSIQPQPDGTTCSLMMTVTIYFSPESHLANALQEPDRV